MLAFQINLCEMLLAMPGEWHSLDLDKVSVAGACALHRLGIARVDGYKVQLASAAKAECWLGANNG
jgi:hypothetical protein